MSWVTALLFLGLLGMSLGAGNTQTSKAEAEGESVSHHHQQVMYRGDNFVLENRGFSVMCNLTLFDQLKWTHNGNPIVAGEGGYWIMEKPAPQGFIGSQVTVAKAQLRHAGDYKCSSLQQRLHSVFILRDSPSNLNMVKNIKMGHPIKLQCNMSSSEAVTFDLAWYKEDERLRESDRVKIFQLNSTLIITKAQEDDVGTYKCEVINDTLVEKIPPQSFKVIWLEVKNLPKSATVTMQEPLVLEIPVKGKPTPSITWMKDDRSISDIFNSSLVKYEANSFGVPRAKLTISNAQMNYRGLYTCTINIFSMTHTTSTFVRVKDVYAALWPFLGIVVEVVVLGIVIFIFEKRRAKAEFEESDTDQGNDHFARSGKRFR